MDSKEASKYIIIDALGNKVSRLSKVSATNFIDVSGIRYKRAFSTGIGYEIRRIADV